MADGAAFMASAVEAFPRKVHAVLTDDGVCLTDQPRCRNGAAAGLRVRVYDRVCQGRGIRRRLTKPCRPWADGQAERMVRTLKEATVKSLHHETRADLEAHLRAYVLSYNLGKHLKGLRWRTPFQATREAWAKDPSLFKVGPHHLIPGPYT